VVYDSLIDGSHLDNGSSSKNAKSRQKLFFPANRNPLYGGFYPVDTPAYPDKINQENRGYRHLSFLLMEIASLRSQ